MKNIKTLDKAELNWENASVADFVLLQAMEQLFGRHPDLLPFVFNDTEPRLRRHPKVIMKEAEALSRGEDLLVRIALDLWNQSSGVGLFELIERLDSGNFQNVIAALRIVGPKPPSRFGMQFAPGRKPDPGWDSVLF